MKKLVGIIPCYQKVKNLNQNEILSIRNTVEKLGSKYSIYIVGPPDLYYDEYKSTFSYPFGFISFDKKYFTSIYSYNLLLKNIAFYQEFISFKYLLIVQTDAFIFNPDYDPFINEEIDYIGAPWFVNPMDRTKKSMYVGNGGYSLRKTSSCIRVLQTDKKMISFKEIWRLVKTGEFHSHNWYLKKVFYAFIYYISQNNFKSGQNIMPMIYEDVFWGIVVPSVLNNFKVASSEMAAKFGFETSPALLFEMNGHKLPTGCHGFQRHEPEFWRKHIPIF